MVRTNTEIRQLVHDFVRALEPTVRVDKVILYGSYANGKPRKWSDVDLAVISRNFARLRRWKRQDILGDALVHNTNMIEALGYSLAEYNHAHRLTFLGEIKRTGKVIYDRRSVHIPRTAGARHSKEGKRTPRT